MSNPGPGFGGEDAVPSDVIEYFSKYAIRLEGPGIVAGEGCVFVVLDPRVTILAHQKVRGSHPEAPSHLWAGRINIPERTICRVLYSWDGSALFLFVRPAWDGFSSTYSE